jgi:hypothetical protein
MPLDLYPRDITNIDLACCEIRRLTLRACFLVNYVGAADWSRELFEWLSCQPLDCPSFQSVKRIIHGRVHDMLVLI